LTRPLRKGSLIVNLRSEGAPELLAVTVHEALKAGLRGLTVKLSQEEAFRPGQPQPTHRLTAA
jgi:hypothetical protein